MYIPKKCNKYHLFFKTAVSWKWGLWKIRTMTELAMCSCSSNEKLQHARRRDSGGSGAIVQLNREQEPKVEHATPQPLKQMPEQPTVPKYSSSCPVFRVPQVHNVQRELSWLMLQITIYLLLNIKFKSKTNSVEGWITVSIFLNQEFREDFIFWATKSQDVIILPKKKIRT